MPFTITPWRVLDTHATPNENPIGYEFWPDYTFYRIHTVKGVDTSVWHSRAWAEDCFQSWCGQNIIWLTSKSKLVWPIMIKGQNVGVARAKLVWQRPHLPYGILHPCSREFQSMHFGRKVPTGPQRTPGETPFTMTPLTLLVAGGVVFIHPSGFS